jgi:hypothetical protein
LLRLLAEKQLETNDSFRLQALWTLFDFKLHSLTLVQALISLSLDCREMDKHILAGLALDEPIALGRVKPLHGSLFSAHFTFLLIY